MKNTLVRTARLRDRLSIRLRGYVSKKPEGADILERCPKCRAKAYGKGKSRVSRTYQRDVYKTCMACGHNNRFGPQGPPPGTPVVEPEPEGGTVEA